MLMFLKKKEKKFNIFCLEGIFLSFLRQKQEKLSKIAYLCHDLLNPNRLLDRQDAFFLRLE